MKKKRTIKQQIAILQEVEIILNRLADQMQDCKNRISSNTEELTEQRAKLTELEAAQAECEDADHDREIRNLKSSIYWNENYMQDHTEKLEALQELAKIIEEAVN